MRNSTKVENRYGYSRRQRIWAWLVLVGIFVCGMMAGAFIWQTKTAHTSDSGLQAEIDACQMRENALAANLNKGIDDSSEWAANAHKHNADIYDRLAKWGCKENSDKYIEMRDAEFATFDVLNRIWNKNIVDDTPCAVIEKSLLSNIDDCGVGYTSECHLRNAEVYSKIAEDGCQENQQKYAQKALDELKISEGVRINETDLDRGEIRATVNTYKKLQMQQEAKKYLNKVEKLVNPGIDFILELQRIIEE